MSETPKFYYSENFLNNFLTEEYIISVFTIYLHSNKLSIISYNKNKNANFFKT